MPDQRIGLMKPAGGIFLPFLTRHLVFLLKQGSLDA
jgi:hypothetical protein